MPVSCTNQPIVVLNELTNHSSDPSVHPVIDPAYLKHPADVAVLAAGLDFVNKTTKTKHLAPIIQTRFYPAASRDLDNAADREEAVKDWVMGEYHLIGTCAMGEVVDSRLRVGCSFQLG